MKLMSGRPYKHDLSDVSGILMEHQKRNAPLSFEQIQNAIINLYGSMDEVPNHSLNYLKSALNTENLEQFIIDSKKSEQDAKVKLVHFEEEYTGVLNEGNLHQILNDLSNKQKNLKHDVLSFSRAAQKSFGEKAAERPQHSDKNKNDIEH